MPEDTQIITKTTTSPNGVNNERLFLNENLSGRFWIALVIVNYLGIATILLLTGTVKLDSNAAIAIYTGFSGGALSLLSVYMGQHQKKETAQTTTAVTSQTNKV